MNPTQAPSLGRIVHFSCDTGAASKLNSLGGSRRYNVGDKTAGMITGVDDNNACFLTLFPVAEKTLAISSVPYSSAGQPGTWTWPEKIGEQVAA